MAGVEWKCWPQGTSISMYPSIYVVAKKKKCGPCSEWGIRETIGRAEHLGCQGWHAPHLCLL